MQKTRKTSHITNIIQFDADGHVVIPASLTLGIAPGADDNSAKVPSTAWVRSIITTAGGALVPTSRTITINGVSLDLSANRSWSINTGVLTATAGAGISVSTVDANLNIVNTGLLTATAGAGISVSTVNQNLNIVNTGLLTATAGAGISVSTVNQNLNIVSTAILTATAGSGISVSVVDQNLNVVNTGLLTATAGSGISISTVNQNLNIVNTGLRTATAGAGISISVVDGNLNIVNTITNNNQLTNGADYATTSFVTTQINSLVAGAPGLLDTLDELAQALGDDPNFATTVTTALSNRLRIDTASQGLNSTQQANGRTNLGLGSLAVLSSVGNAQITDVAWSKVTGAPAFITGNQTITLSGDASGSGATTITVTLANSGVTAGTYTKVTVDAKGRVTVGASLASSDLPTYIGTLTSSQVTTALGYTPYNSSNPSGYITSAALAPYLLLAGGSMTGNISFGSSGAGLTWAANTDGASITFESTGDGASGGRALSNLLIALTDNGDEGLRVTTTGSELLYVNINQFQYRGNNVWHAGNLTNLNQLTNGPGYITGESDTLATVTSRGASTTAQITVDSVISNNNGNGTNYRIGDDAWIGDINLANTFRVQGVQNAANAYIVFGNGDNTALGRAGTGALTYGGNTVWHAGNLTNLNQLTNGPGYITSSGSITGSANTIGGFTSDVVRDILGAPCNGPQIRILYSAGTGNRYIDLGWVDNNIVFSSGLRITNTSTITFQGNTVWHAGNLTNLNQLSNGPGYITSSGSISGSAGSVPWSGVSLGYRTNFELGFRPPDNSNSFAGFRFGTVGNDADAGYFLIRGGADSDVYTQNGITLVADTGWLTLAQRTRSDRGVRIMTGATSTTRLQIDSSGNTDVGLGAGTVTLYHAGSARFWTGSDGTRTQGWAYFQNTSQGLHWPGNQWHLLPADSADFRVHSGNSVASSLRMETNGTIRGYFYAENTNEIGILTNSRSWALRMNSSRNAFIHGQTLTINADNAAWSSIYMNDGDEGMREIHCNSNRIGFLTQGGSWGAYADDGGNWATVGALTHSNSVTEYAGYISTCDDWPNCQCQARVYRIGTLNSGGSNNSFIEVEVFGSHRGFTQTVYVEYKKWIIWVGDRISSNLVASAGSHNQVGLWNGSNANGLLGINGDHVASGWVLRLVVNPTCGAGVNYTVKVKYSNLNMSHGPFDVVANISAPSIPLAVYHVSGTNAQVYGNLYVSNGITSVAPINSEGAIRLNSGSLGNSPRLVFGTENEGVAGNKSMYLENFWLVIQPHVNEGLRLRFVNGVGSQTEAITFQSTNTTIRTKITYTDATYMTGSPSHGFRFNSANDAFNNVIMYDNGTMSVRGRFRVGDVSNNPDCMATFTGNTGASGFSTSDQNNILHLTRNSHSYILLSSPDNFDQGIHFANTSDNSLVGRFAYIHRSSGDSMNWIVNTLMRMSLDAGGTLTTSGDVVAFGSPSDARLKTIKEVVPGALEKVKKLSGYRFDWNEVNSLTGIKEDVGVIAQEVAEVLPELARTNENGYMSVRYQGLTAVLIEAIKEQQAQIEDLKNQITELKENK